MCFGIRIPSPFHLATLILPIANHKCPKNAKNACADVLIGLFSSKDITIASLLQVTSISIYNSVRPLQQRQGTPPVQEVKWKFIDLKVKLSSPERWLISCKPGHHQWGDISASAHAFLAFLGHLWFAMGNIKVARWNGLEILIPKHMWKSKIGLLEQIWGQNSYVTFFLGHPVVWTNLQTVFQSKLCVKH